MREIKFRAFDEDLGKILHHEDGMHVRIYGDCHFIYQGSTAVNGVLMQYTGLKDKNGKEIYEGDVAKFGNDKPDEIIYELGCFTFKSSEDDYHYMQLGKFNLNELEIIGNIYENPDLLAPNKKDNSK